MGLWLLATGLGDGGEEVEGAALDGGRFGFLLPGGCAFEAGLHGVADQRCEIGEQGLKAVDGRAVGGSLRSRFEGGTGGGLLGGDHILARFRRLVVVKEHWSQRLAHVPLDVIGEHAQEDMGSHAILVAVVDGAHLQIDGLDASESLILPLVGMMVVQAGVIVTALVGIAGGMVILPILALLAYVAFKKVIQIATALRGAK